jgi:DNA-binding NarL/FixJ family response regulator
MTAWGIPTGLRVYRIDVRGIALAIVTFEADRHGGFPPLTDAERHVLAALLAGKSNADIAKERETAARTVANQVARLFKKLAVRSRSELVMRVTEADVDRDPAGRNRR